MDLQTMGDNALTSENVPSIDNLRAHSPQTAGDSRPQPDTPIGLEESWRNANSCARCRSPGCAVPYKDRPTDTEGWLRCVRSSFRHRDGRRSIKHDPASRDGCDLASSTRHGDERGGSRIWGEAPRPQEEARHSRV